MPRSTLPRLPTHTQLVYDKRCRRFECQTSATSTSGSSLTVVRGLRAGVLLRAGSASLRVRFPVRAWQANGISSASRSSAMRPAAIQPMGLLRLDPSSLGILGPCSSRISVVPSLLHPISEVRGHRPRAPYGGGDDLTTVPHVHRRFFTIPDDGRFNCRRNNSLRPEFTACGRRSWRPTGRL